MLQPTQFQHIIPAFPLSLLPLSKQKDKYREAI
jgi:hypothetical protein